MKNVEHGLDFGRIYQIYQKHSLHGLRKVLTRERYVYSRFGLVTCEHPYFDSRKAKHLQRGLHIILELVLDACRAQQHHVCLDLCIRIRHFLVSIHDIVERVQQDSLAFHVVLGGVDPVGKGQRSPPVLTEQGDGFLAALNVVATQIETLFQHGRVGSLAKHQVVEAAQVFQNDAHLFSCRVELEHLLDLKLPQATHEVNSSYLVRFGFSIAQVFYSESSLLQNFKRIFF
jgi:hypothetical protein